MLRLILAQIATSAVAAVIAAVLGGWPAVISLLLGAAICILPNALFALRLFVNVRRGTANPFSVLIGELIKIALTVAMLATVAWLYHGINWLALIAGMVVAMKSYLILLFRL
ncbi:ATP synthase subunit I [Massilia sp. W12]|uniref:ATP synthase subunit I n=1 Tax=Massilia sp. W12 TaxID=3126507 RepID=UPI0030D0C9CB